MVKISFCAPVAQPDRAFGFEPKGRGFESLRAHHSFEVFPFLTDSSRPKEAAWCIGVGSFSTSIAKILASGSATRSLHHYSPRQPRAASIVGDSVAAVKNETASVKASRINILFSRKFSLNLPALYGKWHDLNSDPLVRSQMLTYCNLSYDSMLP